MANLPADFKYPSTRYSGSKRQLLEWVWENIRDLPFKSVLDVFGGTGSVSLMFKRYGKKVLYNDVLRFNQIIATALIENHSVTVSDDDLSRALSFKRRGYPNFIRKTFKGTFYLDQENAWLDKAIANFSEVKDRYKRALLFSSLFQAALAKRPFNLFHRANLCIRTNNVKRTFGNKTTWEHPFEDLVRRYVQEYNKAVFNNGKKNKVIGGYDAAHCPNGVDLVYLDPPYFSASADHGTNYLTFYHFLEGIADYAHWSGRICLSNGKTKRIGDTPEIYRWTRKSEIHRSFENLIEQFQDNIIVLSYRSDGIPSNQEILSILKKSKKRVKVFSKPHRYVLSSKSKDELLFIAM